MPNGVNLTCRIIDVSLSGAGIATDQRPPLGALVTLGKVQGRVVRHLEEGFAVEFTRLQHPDFRRRERHRRVNAAPRHCGVRRGACTRPSQPFLPPDLAAPRTPRVNRDAARVDKPRRCARSAARLNRQF